MSSHTTLAALLPHLADLPQRLQAILPRLAHAMATHSVELTQLNQRWQAELPALWAMVEQSADPATLEDWRALPYFRLLHARHEWARRWLEQWVETLELDARDDRVMRFLAHQWIEAISPANSAATNGHVIERAVRTHGQSLLRGQAQLQRDLLRGRIRMCDEDAFQVGGNLATSAGAVIFENELIQLIQYAPRTPQVLGTPLLIVPPFINKFYVLDLSEHNSFVRYALDAGVQVFMLSWRDITPAQGHLTWDDYARLGVVAGMEAVRAVTRCASLHTLGFCVGGTLLAATLASHAPGVPIASLTLLASLLDFREVGDIAVLIDEAYVQRTEQQYAAGGVVDGGQLAGAFASLRPRELIWQFVIQNYLLGETPKAFDMLYWNGDSANLPGPLFAWYLRNCYLENKLREPGALSIGGQAVDLRQLRMPAFVLGTQADHIVPWQSAYRSAQLLGGEPRFVLGGSGHIAGVVSPPGGKSRGYRDGPAVAMEAGQWFEQSTARPGSWWPLWAQWLAHCSARRKAAPKRLGSARCPVIEPAPGRYVRPA